MTTAVYIAATGHIYAGLCPDDAQPRARDPKCPACQATRNVEEALRVAVHFIDNDGACLVNPTHIAALLRKLVNGEPQ